MVNSYHSIPGTRRREEEDWDNTTDILPDDLYGNWVGNVIYVRNASYYPYAFTITLGASDDLSKGNVLVTEFIGYDGTGTGYMDFDTTTGALTIALY